MIEVLAWASRAVLVLAALVAAGHVAVHLAHGVRAPRIFIALVAALAATAGYLLQAASLTGTAAGAVDPVMLGLLWSTAQGTALLCFVGGAVAVVLGAAAGLRWLEGPGALVLLAGFLATGHVADRPELWLSLILAAHLVVAAYWVGILWPLHQIAGQDPARAAQVGEAFGRVAAWAIPVLLVLGVTMTTALLTNVTQLWTTDYGRAMVVKLSAVAAMLALGALNKLRHVPALLAGQTGVGLRRSLRYEAVAALAVIVATAAFSTVAGLP